MNNLKSTNSTNKIRLGSVIIWGMVIGFCAFLAIAFYWFLRHPDNFSNNNYLSFYFFRLPYFIGIISAMLVILMQKAIINEFTPSGDAELRRTWVFWLTHFLLALIFSSFGWLLAGGLIRILSLVD